MTMMKLQQRHFVSFLLYVLILESLPFRTCSLLATTTTTTRKLNREGCLRWNLYRACNKSRPRQVVTARGFMSGIHRGGGGGDDNGSGGETATSFTKYRYHHHDNKRKHHQHNGDDQSLSKDNDYSFKHQRIMKHILQSLSFGRILSNVQKQYAQRIAADSNFLYKSITEVILAAGTQFMAEIGKRGVHQLLTEIDFVIAGILTAIAGKYYSMWRVAPTAKISSSSDDESDVDDASSVSLSFASSTRNKSWDIPTNAFQTNQPYTLSQRLMSFIVPIPSLFQAGVIASAIGYGFTSVFICLRSILFPQYIAATVNVNTIHACLYTGAFMAIVSNIRYQLLQGIVEPLLVDKLFWKFPFLRACMTFAVRLANGLLGSFLAIAGMKMMGLQKLKSG